MRFIPSLTSTDRRGIAAFIKELAASREPVIALFPTCLERRERMDLFHELSAIKSLFIPHVHLRSDMDIDEMAFLVSTFGTEVFNIHSRSSKHAYELDPGEFRKRIFVENADTLPEPGEAQEFGGLCIDFAHWQSAKLLGATNYDGFDSLAASVKIGCCHISAIRPGLRSAWGGFDHHRFVEPSELDYVISYREYLPEGWASLEVENDLGDQRAAIERLTSLLAAKPPAF